MKLYFLGGAREVGRSSILVETQSGSRTKRILLDCGIKLEEDEEEHPLLEEKQMRSLDAVALTHAHLDHSGFLPALYEAGFRGKTYLTKPTRDLIQVLLADYLRINQHASPYGQQDVKMLLAKTEIVESDGQPTSVQEPPQNEKRHERHAHAQRGQRAQHVHR
ncbi:MBL fold metallo-hydrolase, partial [Candidatus Micrarchaeota archaeon]|nr:MBL fold metallo-hydrolase [Candidatus Micrarchaeota archaeon]